MSLSRVPALDGVRGAAVIGVLAYHAGYLQGGFLGVDLFFVLSGFLITGLLVGEHTATGRISLRSFWTRRARRLLPALLLLLVAVAAYAQWLAEPIELDAIRRDGLATIFYVANWVQITAGVSYWDAFKAPSPLEHTWSLAIEEQFYLVWPGLVLVVLRFARGSLRVLAGVTAVLAVASIVSLELLHDGADTSRAYFGSDTRASSLLFGALAAIAFATRRSRHSRHRALPVVSLATVVAVGLAWTTATGTSAWLYRWGLPVTAAASALTIYALAVGAGGRVLTTVLSWAPLRHIGAISYGLYLWHWPVQVVLTPDRAHVDGLALVALHVAAELTIAELSYHLLEMPIRRGALRGWSVRIATPAAIGAAAATVLIATQTAIGVVPPAAASAEVTVMPITAPPLGADQIATRPLRVMVVGDSGAVYLGEGVAAAGGTDAVGNYGVIGCGLPRDGKGTVFPDGQLFADPPECHDWPRRWTRLADEFRPDVAVVMVAWPGTGDREIDGELRHPCEAAFDSYYEDQVELAIDTLQATGAEVFVATSPYASLFGLDRGPIDCLNHAYRSGVAASPGAHLLDLAVWLCAGGTCREKSGETLLRPDGVHFQGQGAAIAGRWVLDEIARTLAARNRSVS